jgi:nucleoside-diphosphate-sugar epimerase
MKILITGGAGRIGHYVVAELAQAGHQVTSFDRARDAHPVRGARYRIGDHEDLGQVVEVCAGMDAVAHLSAIPAPRTYPNALVFRTNVMGTFNVHEAAVIAGVPYVVSTSSQSAYGFAWQHRPFLPKYLPLDEDHPDLSQDAYGLSKMAGEVIAHGFNRRCDLRVCVLRPPLVVQPEMYETAIRSRLRTPAEWSGALFAYVDVRDLAVAFRLALEAPPDVIQDAVFNVAADDALAAEPLATLLPRLDPGLAPLAGSIQGNGSMVSAERIKQTLGWRQQYSWRQILGEGGGVE